VEFTVEVAGSLNGIRIITKNLLVGSIVPAESVEWLMHYLVIPLRAPVPAERGDRVRVTFGYRPGDEIHVLTGSARAERVASRATAVEPAGAARPVTTAV
jgi:hypothetical protein